MRDPNHVGRRVMEIEVPGNRRRGRSKFRWKDKIKEDMQEKGVREHQVRNRTEWRRLERNSDPI